MLFQFGNDGNDGICPGKQLCFSVLLNLYLMKKKISRPKLKESIGIDFILEEQICYFSKQEHLSHLPTPNC